MISAPEIIQIVAPMITAVFALRVARLDYRTGEKSEPASAKHLNALVAFAMILVTVFATWWQNSDKKNAQLELERKMRMQVLGSPIRPKIYFAISEATLGRSVLVVSNCDPELPLYDVVVRLPTATNFVTRGNSFAEPYPDMLFGTIPPKLAVSLRLLFQPNSTDIIQAVCVSTRTSVYVEGFHVSNKTNDLQITPTPLTERGDFSIWGDPIKK